MRKVICFIMIMGMLALGSTAFAEYHAFNSQNMHIALNDNIYKDIGCGYQSTVKGAIILNGTFRMQKGIRTPVGESRLARNHRQITDTYNRYNCREINGLNVCDYAWKVGLFDNELNNLVAADTNNDKQISVNEALAYWTLVKRNPNAAPVVSKPAPSVAVVAKITKDKIQLGDGDVISANIITKMIKIKSSYGTLEFKTSDVSTINFSTKKDVLILKNGDKLSGFIINENFTIKLGDVEIPVMRALIKTITFK